MSQGDIELIVLHEMAHVLGVGTLWSSYMCGRQCVPVDDNSSSSSSSNSNSTSYRYGCQSANDEYTKLMNDKNAVLFINPDDCAHWSGKHKNLKSQQIRIVQ
jgi:hypothetical protein